MGPELPPRVTGYLWGGTQKLQPTGSDKWGCSANSYLQEQLMPWSQGHSPPQGDKCLSRSYPEFCLYLQNSLCVLPWASRCFCCLILPPPAPLTLRHLSVPTDAVKFLAAKVTQLTTVGSPCWNLPPSRIFALACPSPWTHSSSHPQGSFHIVLGLSSDVTHLYFAYIFAPMSRILATVPVSGDK